VKEVEERTREDVEGWKKRQITRRRRERRGAQRRETQEPRCRVIPWGNEVREMQRNPRAQPGMAVPQELRKSMLGN
jgi:hypothetical protein